MRKDYLRLVRAVRQLAEDDPEGAELFCTSPEFRELVIEHMQRQQESEEKLEYLLRLMNKHKKSATGHRGASRSIYPNDPTDF